MKWVNLKISELLTATEPSKIKRMPKGVKGYLEKNTVLEFHPNFLVVDSPVKSQVINVKCGFRSTIKVGAKHLFVTLQKISEYDFVEFGIDQENDMLIVKFGATQVKIVGEK